MEHLLGFVFSWVIGLTPALIYRYGIYVKPIAAKKVFWRLAPIVAVLCIVFKTTVSMLNDGAYNPNPIPWIIIYFVGHWIMTRSKAPDSKNSFEDKLPSAAVEIQPVIVERDPVVKEVLAEVPVEVEECVLLDKEMEVEMAAIDLSDKSDEKFYEIAQKEFDAGDIAKGLMLKAEVAAGGDAGKARLIYIRTRAQELANEAEKRANEERELSSLREALAGAVKDPPQAAAKFLKRIENFRADYPDNAKIAELQVEFEYQHLEERIKSKMGTLALGYMNYNEEIWLFEECLQVYGSFLAEHPEHLKRPEIEKNRGQIVFQIVERKAQALVSKHKYQEALDLYRGLLNQYSEHTDEARKMIEETLPKLIADEPNRKRQAKRNFVVGATLVAGVVAGLLFFIGFFVEKSKQEAKLSREKSEQLKQEEMLSREKNVQEAKLHFKIVTNGTAQTVADSLTGLEWVQAPHSLSGNSEGMTWSSGDDFCANLAYAGHSDWRLPSANELESLVKKLALPVGHPFAGVQDSYYWAGAENGYATSVDMSCGRVSYSPNACLYYVWPVRGGQEERSEREARPGREKSEQGARLTTEKPEQEAEVSREQSGLDTKTRFTVLTNGAAKTVIDNRTGLEWVQVPHSLSGNSSWMTWRSASDFCINLVYAGHSDWRLPSSNELMSVHALAKNLSFANVRHDGLGYWSGKSSASSIVNAWAVAMNYGDEGLAFKTSGGYVWPVRGGQ